MKRLIFYAMLAIARTLSRIRRLLLGPYCEGVLTSANGLLLVAAPDDLMVGRKLAYRGEYDPEQLALYRSRVSADSRILVVGAHVGAIMLPLARVAAHAVGIEANPVTFRLLQMNAVINGIDNCMLHNFAACDTSTTLEFVAATFNSGASMIMPKQRNYEFFHDDPAIVQVQGKRLDDVLPGNFDFVLMDIEGAEYRALAGMQRILQSARTLVCEVVPNQLANAAGIEFQQLLDRIPRNFTKFALTTEPENVVDRSGIARLYERALTTHYFRGMDLVCTSDA